MGSQLHESPEALEFGLKVVGYLKREAELLSEKFGIKFVLEQSPAENYRLPVREARFKILFSGGGDAM